MSFKENSSKIDNKESLIDSENNIKLNTNADLKEDFNIDKEKIRKQLEAAKNVEERVKLFSKWADSY
jgi:hypothetical protein